MGAGMLSGPYDPAAPRKNENLTFSLLLYRCTACLLDAQRLLSIAPFLHEHPST